MKSTKKLSRLQKARNKYAKMFLDLIPKQDWSEEENGVCDSILNYPDMACLWNYLYTDFCTKDRGYWLASDYLNEEPNSEGHNTFLLPADRILTQRIFAIVSCAEYVKGMSAKEMREIGLSV